MSAGLVAPRRPGSRGASLARAAVLVAGLTAAGQLLGFVRDAVIAAVYGAGAAVDAYLVAQGLMNLVLGLVASAVAKSVVPTVARAVADGCPERGHRSARVALTLTVSVLSAASLVMAAAAPAVVTVLAPGFGPQARALAIDQTRIVLLATVLIAATNVLAAVAQAHGRFVLAGLQGLPFNLVMLAGAALLGPRYGAAALAWSFVAASLARLVVQLPAIRAVGMRLRPSFAVRDTGFRELVVLIPPLLVGSAVTNVNLLTTRAIGSAQGEGTIAALNYGFRLVNLADTLVLTAIVATLYPTLSASAARETRHELRVLTGRSVRVTLVLLGPVVTMTLLAAEPMVRLVFGRGEFDEAAVQRTSSAVVAFAAIIAATALRELLARAFYAVGDSRTPVVAAVIGMAVNVASALVLGRAYGVAGLAAATTAAAVLVATLLLVVLQRRHGAVNVAAVLATLARVLVAGGLAALPTALLLSHLPSGPAASAVETGQALALAGVVLLGGYAGVLHLLCEGGLREALALLRSGLRRAGR